MERTNLLGRFLKHLAPVARNRSKVLQAIGWSAVDFLFRGGIQFVALIALAGFLEPEDFGVAAVVGLFTAIGTAIADGGLTGAIVQRKSSSLVEESTCFWLGMGSAAICALTLVMIAPLIAKFYSEPELENLSYAASFVLLVQSTASIHTSLAIKRLDFKLLLKCASAANVTAAAGAITLASQGFGVWALIAQSLISATISAALLWVLSPWRPCRRFCWRAARSLFAFGGYLMASTVLEILYTRTYTLLLGRFYAMSDVGIYNNADQIKQLPANLITGIISRVAFPVFSSELTPLAVKQGMQIAVKSAMLLNAPVMLGLAVLAEPLILTLFGEKWIEGAPILQILAVSAVLWPIHALNVNVLLALGKSKLVFRIQIAKMLVGVMFTIIGSFYGMRGIAWAQLAMSLFSLSINTYFTNFYLRYGLLSQIRDLLPIVTLCLPTTALIGLLVYFSATGAGATLFFGVLVASTYPLAYWISGQMSIVASLAAWRAESGADSK